MALKPTIYKAQLELADSDRNHYETLSLIRNPGAYGGAPAGVLPEQCTPA